MLMVVAEAGGMPGLIVNQPPVVTPADHANARLIAAAPDLLAALKSVLSVGGGTTGFSADHPTNIAIRAAIAKAEGK